MRRNSLTFASSAVVAVLLHACGGVISSDDGGVDADASMADTSAETEASADGGCNEIINTGAAIDVTKSSQMAPSPEGGAVADGTYDLTAIDDYDGEGGAQPLGLRSTFVIAGNVIQFVDDTADAAPIRGTLLISTSGTTMTMTQTCPTSSNGTSAYSATSSEVEFFYTVGPNEIVEDIYTRQ
jgi:hypothetical protein